MQYSFFTMESRVRDIRSRRSSLLETPIRKVVTTLIKQWFGLKLFMSIVALLFFIGPQYAMSANIKWRTQPFFHVSENEPIDEFLKGLFSSQDVVLSISDEVKDQTVSGKFDDPPQKVFKQIAKAFDLTSYCDGNIFYVLRSGEISSKIISLKHLSTRGFKRILSKLNVLDSRFPIQFHAREGIVHVFGPAPYIDMVEETARLMDTPDKAGDLTNDFTIPRTIHVFRLKNAWAEDQFLNVNGRSVRVQGVVTILRDLIQGNSDTIQTQPPENDEKAETAPPGSQAGKLISVNFKKRVENPLKDLKSILPENTSRQVYKKSADVKVVVQAAERLNAVLIKDSYLNMPYYQILIDQLDVPLQLVEIKATIVDISSDALKNLGVDLRGGMRDEDLRIFGSSRNSQRKNNFGSFPFGKEADGLSLNTILGKFADDYFLAKINAMESTGKAKIVSRPSVITFDNIEAQFKHTDTFFVRVAAERDASLYEISTGIVLKVTPHVINEEKRTKIQLIVNIEDGMVTEKSVDDIPVVKNSNINTQAIVEENNSLLIGGLIHEQKQTINNKVPFLGDIPLLGAMFRSKRNTKNDMERLFLISPRIIESGIAEMQQAAVGGPPMDTPTPQKHLPRALMNATNNARNTSSNESRPLPHGKDKTDSQLVIFNMEI